MEFKFKGLYKSTLIKSTSIYTISSVINSAIPFFLLPFLTSRLTPKDYGIVSMFQIALSFLLPFISLNLDAAISRAYYEYNKIQFSNFIGNCILLTLSSLSFVSIFLFIFQSYIGKYFSLSYYLIVVVALISFFQATSSILLSLFQVTLKPFNYGLLQIVQTFLNLALTVILIYYFNMTWEGRINALFYSTLFVAIFAIWYLIKFYNIKFGLNNEYLISSLKFGVPLIPHAIGGIVFTTIDRVFLTEFYGVEQTGNYSVSYQLGAIVSLLTFSFNNAFVPWLYQNLSNNNVNSKIKIVKFTYVYFILLAVFATFFLLIFPHIVIWMVDKSYKSINSYSVFIVYGFVFQGMYYMVTNYITFAKKTIYQSFITFFVALLKLPITYFSLLFFGISGASISFCFTFFIFFILTWIVSHKVYPMPWFLKNNI